MVTKQNRKNGKSGITLVELIVTIVIISMVTISVVSAIVVLRHFSYINGVKEKCAVAINSIADMIITDIDTNGIDENTDHYKELMDMYLDKVDFYDLLSVGKDNVESSVAVSRGGFTIINGESGTEVLQYYTMQISIEVGKGSKYGVSAKQTICLPQKSSSEN